MLELAERAVRDALAAGADYADARIVRSATEELCLRNGELAEADAPLEFGLAVRALVNGAFGFAAAPGTHRELADLAPGVARRAARMARDLAPARRRRVTLAPASPAVGEYHTPVAEDPFRVPLEEKLELLREVDAALAGRDGVVLREARLAFRRAEHWLATSDGAAVHQVLVRSGGGVAATASVRGVVETRSGPGNLGREQRTGGFEVVRALDLLGLAPRVRDEAVALCGAPPCPAGRRTLILGASQLAAQLHATVGHPTELDRVHGEELDCDGGSFLAPSDAGHLAFGSRLVQVSADATLAGGLDTRGFDDEGTPSRRVELVRDGVLVGFQTSREWSAVAGAEASGGGLRAEGWYTPPILRATNLTLAPGAGTLAELLARTEDGAFFVDSARSWSVDAARREFQFTCEVAYEVRGGRLGRLHRAPTYRGTNPEFWTACDAITGAGEWRVCGAPVAAKGNPPQSAEVSHGAAPARFRGVELVAR